MAHAFRMSGWSSVRSEPKRKRRRKMNKEIVTVGGQGQAGKAKKAEPR